ncbi:MAG: site-specific DNA-methyltransferase [Candidatus Tectomicrobia bacterium]|nr:site-specific DNA-methyltransferase [Candidatus Tectomicrobia bacterium]
MAKKNTRMTSVESLRHKDKRRNIPTEELRGFVAEEEAAPRTMLYPRDPSLDPQLVWKGKDEQDREDLAVPVAPVYIQEKIHPQALIEDLRRRGGKPKQEQLDLFADFNGIDGFDKKVEFYQYDANWSNRMILGDSLLVMTSLAEKEGLKGKVQTIYLDPPYGIKFGSNWQVSTRKRDVKDGKAEDASREPEQIRAFRDTWKLGIHSYLAYLRDRLVAARELLTETGSVFVQIGDENVHLVRCLMDEVFGSENFCGLIFFLKTTGKGSGHIDSSGDYLIWYSKSTEHTKVRSLYILRKSTTIEAAYTMIESIDGSCRRLTRSENLESNQLIGKRFMPSSIYSDSGGKTTHFIYEFQGYKFSPLPGYYWRTTKEGMRKLETANRLIVSGKYLRYKMFADDYPVVRISNYWDDVRAGGFGEAKIYAVQTNTDVVSRCLLMTTDPGDLVLDPTCGSGTTAYVAEQWGRRWITIDTSRVALALARTRLMAAKYPYYYLADAYPQITPMNTDEEIKNYLRKSVPSVSSVDSSLPDIRKGFVYKRVPHVTLKSIANNPDIREGMTRAEIDAAITRHADQETLYDQPYPDSSRARVAGPFTVESLSPHRTLSTEDTDEKKKGSTHLCSSVQSADTPKNYRRSSVKSVDDFAVMILDNLKKAGVQNTRKAERLRFERLEPFAGRWLQAAGEYAGSDGASKRVAVSIGPEHGTVGAEHIHEAAKEALQGVRFDVLVVCGFAFDPHVSEEAKRYGDLTVLVTRMNPDLMMGEELLKKSGAANLFMVFGEPDVEIRRIHPQMTQMTTDKRNLRESVKSADQFVVAIKGLDVYDPTTGQIRTSSTDDIACWFIDTNYDEESFFVRHAYFTGAEEPYDKLKRALRAEIDEAAWASLYSTTSRPFDPPETGKIAIKVINHYGDEVLKVYAV